MTLLEAYGGRLAIETTMEPPSTVSRNQRSKIPDKREKGMGWRDRQVSAEEGLTFACPSPDRYDSRQLMVATWRAAWASIRLMGMPGRVPHT